MAKVEKKNELRSCFLLLFTIEADWLKEPWWAALWPSWLFVCVIASTDGYHTEDRGSWNVLCRRWICGVWTFCSAGRTSWGVNRTYTCSNSNNFTNHGTLRYSQGCRFSGKPYWRWPWVFQVIYIDTFILCIFFLFLDKSHTKEEVFHNGFFSLILPRKAISGKNCQRVLVDLVYYMVVQDVVWYWKIHFFSTHMPLEWCWSFELLVSSLYQQD